ncbi:related to multidrug resistant protein [Phialocephala subalpina]|uniref:Related to multidrug resistant protein n=1 Tax=Phialocephala subalpina TaxID=576137 RepID=A0A1L7XPS2_9HELO|nr:related to multidrug resistant protein [Phialocephala subalpina]
MLFFKSHKCHKALSEESIQGPDVEAAIPPPSPVTEIHTDEEKVNPNMVHWDGPNDPKNPRNWSTGKKVLNIAFVSMLCFITPVASAMFAPGVPKLMQEFHSTNEQLGTFVVSVFVLGFATGPMILAPLSEIFGRLPIYHITNVLFLVFTIACAVSKNFGMLIAFRFLAGATGSAPIANGGGTISDLIMQEKRGAAMAIFGIGPLLGPVIGPIAGGYLTQAAGWRWVFWLIAIAMGILSIIMLIFADETYGKVILERKAAKLRKETGNNAIKSHLHEGLTSTEVFERALIRPLKLLCFSPIVLALSVFQGLCFGCMYLLFTTFSRVFTEVYHWNTGSDGLAFLGMGVGLLIALVVFGSISDRILKAKAGGGELKPEYRLLPMIPATIFISAGLFWYGWSVKAKDHWIVPIIGTVFVGFGYLPIILATQTYLVDAYEEFSASALAASTILRSLMGALVPLAGTKMYQTMGYGWGNSLLAFITLAMLPFPWLFYTNGERLRKKYTISL